VTSSGKELEV